MTFYDNAVLVNTLTKEHVAFKPIHLKSFKVKKNFYVNLFDTNKSSSNYFILWLHTPLLLSSLCIIHVLSKLQGFLQIISPKQNISLVFDLKRYNAFGNMCKYQELFCFFSILDKGDFEKLFLYPKNISSYLNLLSFKFLKHTTR